MNRPLPVKQLIRLLLTYYALVLIIILTAGIMGFNLNTLLLVDDGYYELSKKLAAGESILYQRRGPGLPIILSTLSLFPESMHFALRVLITLIFSTGIIILTAKILTRYLSDKQVTAGLYILVFNPVYLHWSVKSSPEVYLGFLLLLFVLMALKMEERIAIKYIVLAALALIFSIFIKPVFIFIPVFLLGLYLILRKWKLVLVAILMLIFTIASFQTFKHFTTMRSENIADAYYGELDMIADVLWVNWIIQTKQFHKPSKLSYQVPEKLEKVFNEKYLWLYKDLNPDLQLYDAARRYAEEYFKNNPDGTAIGFNLQFCLDYPVLVIQKLILSPFFFLSMSANPLETFIKLAYSLLFVVIGIVSISKILNEKNRIEIAVIFVILAGYVSLHIITHAMNRYSYPILPLITVWAGYYVDKWYDFFGEIVKKKIA